MPRFLPALLILALIPSCGEKPTQPPKPASQATQPAQPAPAPAPLDWKVLESPYLSNHTQLTLPERFLKAGEAYFDHFTPPRWVVFQAVERPKPGETANASADYAMYAARLGQDDNQGCLCLSDIIRISPDGSANTCAWFAPLSQEDAYGRILFGSTLKPLPPSDEAPGYSRDRSRYTWKFPVQMRIVERFMPEIWTGVTEDLHKSSAETPPPMSPRLAAAAAQGPQELITPPNGPGYMAECSWSPAGRSILYTYVDPKTKSPDLWVWDRETRASTPLIQAEGYDGGPFFSPDGKWICYRSDRKGDNNLQLFVAELAFDEKDAYMGGRITGIKREYQLTGGGGDDKVVSWCPYWHPSMKYLVYATSAMGHSNYEVFAIEFDAAKVRATPLSNGGSGASAGEPGVPPVLPSLRRARITSADGFDGLPAFSADGALMMWTSNRGPALPCEARPSTQLWIANLKGEPVWDKK